MPISHWHGLPGKPGNDILCRSFASFVYRSQGSSSHHVSIEGDAALNATRVLSPEDLRTPSGFPGDEPGARSKRFLYTDLPELARVGVRLDAPQAGKV
jgi:hypothetical protein